MAPTLATCFITSTYNSTFCVGDPTGLYGMITPFPNPQYFVKDTGAQGTYGHMTLSEGVTSIAAGAQSFCVAYSGGSVKCWGTNTAGACGTDSGFTGPFFCLGKVTFGHTYPAVSVTAGGTTAAALFSNGAIIAWGSNAQGVLGQGTTVGAWGNSASSSVSSLPFISFQTTHPATKIALSATHMCATFFGGAVRCWGGNANSQLGVPASSLASRGLAASDMTVAAFISFAPTLGVVVDVDAGTSFSCAVFGQGSALCWGLNADGQLGRDGTAVLGSVPGEMSTASPIAFGIPTSSSRAVSVSAGVSHTCAIFLDVPLSSTWVRCWGSNTYNYLLTGDANSRGHAPGPGSSISTVPYVVWSDTHMAVEVDTGADATCVLFSNSRARCLGYGSNLRLGQGNGLPMSFATLTPFIDLKPSLAALLSVDGLATNTPVSEQGADIFFPAPTTMTVTMGVGGGTDNQALLRLNSKPASVVSPAPLGTAVIPVHVEAGLDGSQLVESFTYLCPGDVATTLLPDRAISVCAGTYSSCVLFANNNIKCFGDDFGGAGSLTGDMTSLPIIAFSHSTAIISIHGGGGTYCVLFSGGGISCFGNSVAMLGLNGASTPPVSLMPMIQFQTTHPASDVSVGSSHVCARFTGGGLRCWGMGQFGRLGFGSADTADWGGDAVKSTSLLPFISFSVGVNSGALSVSAGDAHTCAVTSTAKVVCFGQGDRGQLGNGATTSSAPTYATNTAIPVIPFTTTVGAVSVASYWKHSCALFSNGRIICWGYNFMGQLGYDSTGTTCAGAGYTPSTCSSVPFITFSDTVAAVRLIPSSTATSTCIIFANQRVRCLGYPNNFANGYGNGIAYGSSSGVSSVTSMPYIQFPAGQSAVMDMAFGAYHAVAVVNYQVFTFGEVNNGNLGRETFSSYGSATEMASGPFLTFLRNRFYDQVSVTSTASAGLTTVTATSLSTFKIAVPAVGTVNVTVVPRRASSATTPIVTFFDSSLAVVSGTSGNTLTTSFVSDFEHEKVFTALISGVNASTCTATTAYRIILARQVTTYGVLTNIQVFTNSSRAPAPALSPAFDTSPSASYTVTIPTDGRGALVRVQGSIGSYVLDGSPISLNVNNSVPVTASSRTLTILSAAPPRMRTTTVVITAKSIDAGVSLVNVTVRNAVTGLSTTTTYAALPVSLSVPCDVASFKIAVVTRSAAASLTVAGAALPSGTASAVLALALGPNAVPVVVTSEWGAPDVTSSAVTVTRLSNVSALASLADSRGAVTAFSPLVLSYGGPAAFVPNATTFLANLTFTAAHPGATVTVLGAPAAGNVALNLPLPITGINSIPVVVTSEDGTSVTTYTVKIYRQSADATLAGLATSPPLVGFVFTPSTLAYTATLTNSSNITFTPACAGPACTVSVDGSAFLPPTATVVQVAPGAAGRTIAVTSRSEDGTATATYTLTVTSTFAGAGANSSYSGSPPTVTAASPTSGVFVPGQTVITLSGTSFGASAPGLVSSVTFAGAPCSPVVWQSSTSITCVMGAGAGTVPNVTVALSTGLTSGAAVVPAGMPAVITLGAPSGGNSTSSVAPAGAPAVVSVAPASGPLSGGTLVTIMGSNLGLSLGDLLRVSVGTADCTATRAYISSSSVTCVTGPVSSSGPVTAYVTTGRGPGSGGLYFYTYPPPLISLVNPRVLSVSSGGATITLRGSYFGTSASSASLIIELGSTQLCTSPVFVTNTEVTCTVPPTPAGVVQGAVVPVRITVNGQASPPSNVGLFSLKYGTPCTPSCDWLQECIAGSCSGCLPGWTGAKCTTPLFVLGPPGYPVTSEDGDSVKVTVRLTSSPASLVRFTASSSLVTEGKVSPAALDFAADTTTLSQDFVVTGVPDGVRDGVRGYSISVAVAPESPPAFTGVPALAAIDLLNLDAKPKIVALSPRAVPYAGGNVTLTGADWDSAVVIQVDNAWNATDVARVSYSDPALQKGVRRLAGLQAGQDAAVFSAPPRNATGYVPVRVINADGVSVVVGDQLFYTEDCLQENTYGRGASCRPCPKGGICPGGNRIWPSSGYWNSGEESGFVAACEPPEACLGGRDGTKCAPGYKGTMCKDCVRGYYSLNAACVKCPSKGGTITNFVVLIVFWIAFAMCIAFVRDRMTLSYIVLLVKALQTLGGIGASSTSKLPRWLLSTYKIFRVVSGDMSFINSDCVNPMPFTPVFFLSVAYALAIFAPILVFLPFIRMYLVSQAIGRGASQEELQALYFYFRDRLVRAVYIWLSMIYLSITSLAFEALSCVPVRSVSGAMRFVMITRGEECYKGSHIVVCAFAVLLIFALTIGFPIFVLKRIYDNPGERTTSERFKERLDYFYQFFNDAEVYVWCLDFLASIIVASGKSFLRPHVNYQMIVSVIVFGFKVIYIIARRPYIDWITDVIQGILAIVSLVAVNINFFERRGISNKIPNFSSAMAITMFVIFSIAIGALAFIIVWLVIKGAPKQAPGDVKAEGEAGGAEVRPETAIDEAAVAIEIAKAPGDATNIDSTWLGGLFSMLFGGDSAPPATDTPADGNQDPNNVPGESDDTSSGEAIQAK